MITFSQLGKLGRLGNQMFQIATVLGYSHKHKTGYSLPKWEYSQYFNSNLTQHNVLPKYRRYQEPSFTYNEIPRFESIDIYGYFQSEKYFEHCKDFIKGCFEPSQEAKEHLKKFSHLFNTQTCSIHVRRGDYLTLSDYHYNQPIEYYEKAINQMDGCLFLVFSDDMAWCKENFRGSKFIFIEGESNITDFFLMSKCNHNIIANSSFSWWASYLNKNENKTVIAPSRWFGDKLRHDTKDLYLKNWIII